MKNESRKFVTHQAWVEGKWVRDVVLSVAPDGTWASVLPNASAAQQVGATRLPGAVLPGVVNAHSHALQRARAGLAERRSAASSDVASPALQPLPHLPHLPRLAPPAHDRRLSPAERVTPEQLEAVATQLYAELLVGGYTHVCEFLYLHPTAAGADSSDSLAMAQALVRASQRVGLGLTLLPTLPPRSGRGGHAVSDRSAALADGPAQLMRVVEAINRQAAAAVRPGSATGARAAKTAGPTLVGAGIGLHTLDTADCTPMRELAADARKTGLPVHIHIAEHTAAVDDCLARTGQTPLAWLLDNSDVDARWNLVHATHASPAELKGVRSAGAAIVVCPSTAANLGRGVFDLPAFANVGGNWSIGSDRHVARGWPEELRLLEYALRLQRGARHVAAQAAGRESSAAVLFDAAVAGGQAATGQRVGPIQVGRRADFLVLDPASPSLLGQPGDHHLDVLLFSTPTARFSEVFVAGVRVVKDGRVVGPKGDAGLTGAIGQAFVPVMQALLAPAPAAAAVAASRSASAA
jgi:formimidoylglutamate deiminase